MSRWAELTIEQKKARLACNKAWRKRNAARVRAYDAKYYAASPEKNKAKNRAYYAANATRRIAAARLWAKNNPERAALNGKRAGWRRDGIDVGAAEQALLSHNEKCGCCGRSAPGGRHGKWNVDHDHKTGKVRGVLCMACNVGIGKLGDTLDGVLRAVKYLQRNQEK